MVGMRAAPTVATRSGRPAEPRAIGRYGMSRVRRTVSSASLKILSSENTPSFAASLSRVMLGDLSRISSIALRICSGLRGSGEKLPARPGATCPTIRLGLALRDYCFQVFGPQSQSGMCSPYSRQSLTLAAIRRSSLKDVGIRIPKR